MYGENVAAKLLILAFCTRRTHTVFSGICTGADTWIRAFSIFSIQAAVTGTTIFTRWLWHSHLCLFRLMRIFPYFFVVRNDSDIWQLFGVQRATRYICSGVYHKHPKSSLGGWKGTEIVGETEQRTHGTHTELTGNGSRSRSIFF